MNAFSSLGLALCLASVTAAADDAPQSAWSGASELGYLFTSGNTDTSNLNGKFNVKHEGQRWDKALKLTARSSKEDGETSKEKYSGELQLDRNFSKRSYLASVLKQERDRFSGFEYQTTAAIGYGYRIFTQDELKWHIEAGPGYRRDKIKDSDLVDEEWIGRLASKLTWGIAPTVQLIQEISAEPGQDNSVYESETSLKSTVIGTLATKISYSVSYTDKVPEDKVNTDREFGVTLVYSF
ncbi:hypothetical protein GCM10011297_27770 [Bacterioplanes sanyensis]|uniref:DUF481 domain-containing protein n=1 Tax=Bacterioplanes sanyensis TaxID=1249553 RepID=UPI00167C4262|nr:DUF481 domain-containing protein [Bacterioplanes sanyensis]GGY53387.1 hypothetical protein GCM10011297_27770 [Bacterioplanes sanyensis]